MARRIAGWWIGGLAVVLSGSLVSPPVWGTPPATVDQPTISSYARGQNLYFKRREVCIVITWLSSKRIAEQEFWRSGGRWKESRVYILRPYGADWWWDGGWWSMTFNRKRLITRADEPGTRTHFPRISKATWRTKCPRPSN